MRQDYEDTIDIVDMLIFMAGHWRSLVVVLLVGCVLGGGFGVLKYVKSLGQGVTTQAETQLAGTNGVASDKISIEELKKSIGDYVPSTTTLENMERAAGYREMYNKQLLYIGENPVLAMDYKHMYIGSAQYLLQSGEDTEFIKAELSALCYDDNLMMDALRTIIGKDVETQYIRQLLGVSFTTNGGNMTSGDGAVLSATKVTYTCNVVVKYDDEEMCGRLFAAVVQYMDGLCDGINSRFGGNSITKLNEYTYQYADSSIENSQKAALDSASSYLKLATDLEAKFKDEDLTYYNAYYCDGEYSASTETATTAADDSMDAAQTSAVSWKTVIKYLIIGVFAAFFLWACWYVAKYVFDGHVKIIQEIRDQYRVPLLGCMGIAATGNGFERRLHNLKCRQQGATADEAYITKAMEETGVRSLLFVGNRERTLERIAPVVEHASSACGGIEIYDSVYSNPATLEKLKAEGDTAVVVVLDGTRKDELRQTMETCQLHDIQVKAGIVMC